MRSPRNLGRGTGGDGGVQHELFEPPPFSPIYPAPTTLEGRALAMLLQGDELEHPDFERATGSWRLAAYIEELRDKGWPVQTRNIARADRIIAGYQMPVWVIELIGSAQRNARRVKP